jgi:putative endonuclease
LATGAEEANVKDYGWKVYIVRCADGTLYTGISPDVERRVKTHNKGRGAKYTSRRLPVRLEVQSRLLTHREALRAERTIKRLARDQKIEGVRQL